MQNYAIGTIIQLGFRDLLVCCDSSRALLYDLRGGFFRRVRLRPDLQIVGYLPLSGVADLLEGWCRSNPGLDAFDSMHSRVAGRRVLLSQIRLLRA